MPISCAIPQLSRQRHAQPILALTKPWAVLQARSSPTRAPRGGRWLEPEVTRSEGASVHATTSVYRSNPTHEWRALQRPESGLPPAPPVRPTLTPLDSDQPRRAATGEIVVRHVHRAERNL